MNKTFFISSSIPKVKYYWLEEPNIYHNLGGFTMCGDFTWMLSDCEELVGFFHREDGIGLGSILRVLFPRGAVMFQKSHYPKLFHYQLI